ncbi:MAG: glycosyltransferase family 4 protein [Lentisphaeria bacterium]|nr:glycosyltransferase family 4 protein [Lentisphaeria bacterium]
MKILILCNNDLGLYKFRKELLQEFRKRNYDVTIVLPGGPFVPRLKEMGCRCIELNFERRGKNPFADFSLFCKYRRIIKETRPDAVLTYTIKPNIYGGMACRLLKVPYIVNITGLGTALENPGWTQKICLFLYKIALSGARKVFFQNTENRDFMLKRGVVPGAYELLPGSGVNLMEFAPLPYPEGEAVKFLFIGRVMRDKGIDELLAAAKTLKRENLDFSLDVVGGMDEDYGTRLKAAEDQGLIKYHGIQANVAPFIADAHCIVLPSYHEGMANVLLEAAASARPVIATRVHGCMETYNEGESGLGCEAADAESLADAMRNFIRLGSEAKRNMGLAGRRKVESEFDRQIVVSAYIAQIEELTKN